MDLLRSKRTSAHEPLDGLEGHPSKRISTPAGQRLSMIIESTQARRGKSPAAKTAKINVTTTSTYCNDPLHQHIGHVHPAHREPKKETKKLNIVSAITGGKLNTPRESIEGKTPNGSNLSVSVWSDKEAETEKFGQVRHNNNKGAFGRWTRKKMAIVGAILLALIIALAVGLAMGLKKKPSGSASPSLTSGSAQPAGNQASPTTGGGTETDKPSTPTSAVAPSAMPSGFPLGTYSLIAFLDTVQSACTANNATWACTPNTNYYDDPQKALTILTWTISGSAGAYEISSKGQDATFGTIFQNEQLNLLDAGKDTERYRFQLSRTKTVNMTGSIGDQSGSFECDYGATTIQGSLYTKMARTYPQDTIAVGNTDNPNWPFAARVEQTVGGGENVPSCKKSSGEQVSSLAAQGASTLCSCLYKNWTPARIGG